MTSAAPLAAGLCGLGALAGVAFFLTRHTLWRIPRNPRLPRILMYHRVAAAAPPSGMNTPPAMFEEHLKILKAQGKTFCTVSELADRCRAEKDGGGNLVALTFDDGWLDNWEEMFPILRRHGAKATIYLAPQCPDTPILRPDHIRSMQGSGLVEFGAHTVRHVNLLKTGDDAARREIAESKAMAETLSGAPCRSFAYPYGRFDGRHEAMVREAGFDTAVSTKKDIRPWQEEDRFRLCRISVNGAASRWQFRIALSRARYRI